MATLRKTFERKFQKAGLHMKSGQLDQEVDNVLVQLGVDAFCDREVTMEDLAEYASEIHKYVQAVIVRRTSLKPTTAAA